MRKYQKIRHCPSIIFLNVLTYLDLKQGYYIKIHLLIKKKNIKQNKINDILRNIIKEFFNIEGQCDRTFIIKVYFKHVNNMFSTNK